MSRKVVRGLQVWETLDRIKYRVEKAPYKMENVPMLKRPFEAVSDWRTRRLVMPFPVQLGKTIFMQACILWGNREDPRDTMWLSQDDQNTLEFSTTRMLPDLKTYLPELIGAKNYDTKNNLAMLQNGTFLVMLSGENRKNLQSRPAPRVWNDEASILTHGRLSEAEKRGEAYQLFDQFHGVISTPEDDESEFFEFWEDSTREQWSIGCKSCNRIQALNLKAYKWDSSDITCPDGEWDYAEMAKTIRVACQCGAETYLADHRAYKELLSTGHYVVTNPKGPKYHIGCQCSGFSNPRRSASILITRFLKAQKTAKRGIIGPLKEVIQKDFGEFWKNDQHTSDGHIQSGGYLMGDTDWSDEMVLGPDHRCRNMTVDVQDGYFVVVIRMWASNGDSRLLYTDQVNSWSELEGIQKKFGVWGGFKSSRKWIAGRVFVDSAWQGEHTPGMKSDYRVFAECAKNNWHAIQASPSRETWVIKTKAGSIRRPWSAVETRSAGNGVYCRGLHFGVTTISQHLARLMAQETECKWETPTDAPGWYNKQLRSKVMVDGKFEGKNDHAWDCYHPTTKVLTDSGWKHFQDLDGSEKLGTVNLESDELQYQKPSHLIKRDYSGELVRIKNKRIDLMVTPTHRMIAKKRGSGGYQSDWEVVLAEDLNKWHKLKATCGSIEGDGGDVIRVGDRDIDKIAVARVVGWFVTEGHLYSGRQKNGSTFQETVLSQNPGKLQEIMLQDMERLGVNVGSRADRQFYMNDKDIHAAILDWCYVDGDERGCLRKRVPKWILDSDKQVLEAFWETAVLGDGWNTRWESGSGDVVGITSRQLALDLAEVVFKLGGRTRIVKRLAKDMKPSMIRGREVRAIHDQYYIRREAAHPYSLRDGDNNSSISRIDYTGPVYCATVPNGTLVVMDSRERTLVAGNCEKFQLPQSYSDGVFGLDAWG